MLKSPGSDLNFLSGFSKYKDVCDAYSNTEENFREMTS
jgi:hypothetical protein